MINALSAFGAAFVILLFVWMNNRQMARLDDARLEQFWRMPASRVRRVTAICRFALMGFAVFIAVMGVVALAR